MKLTKNIFFITTCVLILNGCSSRAFNEKSTPILKKNIKDKPTKISRYLFNKLVKEELKIDLNEKDLEWKAYQPVGLPVFHIPDSLKRAILAHENISPTPYSQKANVLTKCQLIGTRIELDDRQQTSEWLVTPDYRCPSHSPNKVKTYWIVQKPENGKATVLIADRGKTLSIWKKGKAPLRKILTDIEITKPSRFTTKPIPVMCHKDWSYKGGKYVSQYAGVEVYKESSMSSFRQWTPVSGKDSLTNIDENFQCSAR